MNAYPFKSILPLPSSHKYCYEIEPSSTYRGLAYIKMTILNKEMDTMRDYIDIDTAREISTSLLNAIRLAENAKRGVIL